MKSVNSMIVSYSHYGKTFYYCCYETKIIGEFITLMYITSLICIALEPTEVDPSICTLGELKSIQRFHRDTKRAQNSFILSSLQHQGISKLVIIY